MAEKNLEKDMLSVREISELVNETAVKVPKRAEKRKKRPFTLDVLEVVIVAVVMAVFLRSTYLGRHAIAMGGNEEAARVSGVHVKRMRYIVYIIMGACVAIAAIIMDGRVASAQPTAGAGMEMDAIAAVVIGGTPLSGGYGNVLGSVFGCLIVGLINNGLNILNVSSYWQWIAKGALIIIAIMLDVQTSSLIKATKKRKA